MHITITVNVNIPAIADLAYTLQDMMKYKTVGEVTKQVTQEAPVAPVAEKVDKPVEAETKTISKSNESAAPKVTEVELRAKFVELSKKGLKSELKDLLTELRVEKVSDLKPEQFDEAMAKLEAM